jgi:hypothetical protein
MHRTTAATRSTRARDGVEAERQCCEIRLRAERKAGEPTMEKAKAGPPVRNRSVDARPITEAPLHSTISALPEINRRGGRNWLRFRGRSSRGGRAIV